MGGMLALEWAVRYRACSPAHPSARRRGIRPRTLRSTRSVARYAMADPAFMGGRYIDAGTFPAKGLSVARMTAHVTYLSEVALQEKFGRRLQNKEKITFGFDVDFQVESYLHHQGRNFVERFDPNSYLYITRAMDYFDLEADAGGNLAHVFKDTPIRFCVVSFSSDWLFPTSESRPSCALNAVAANVSFTEVITDKGHDAFLLDVPAFHATLRGFLDGCALARGIQ